MILDKPPVTHIVVCTVNNTVSLSNEVAINVSPGPNYLLFTGELQAAIERDFGSFDNFKTQMSAKTVAIQGSGWGWLVSL